MVHDLTPRLAARGISISPARPRFRADRVLSLLRRCAGAGRATAALTALHPPLVLALACGTLAWAACAATAAVHLVGGILPLPVGFAVARWTFLTAAAVDLLHYGIVLEHARWSARREAVEPAELPADPPPAA